MTFEERLEHSNKQHVKSLHLPLTPDLRASTQLNGYPGPVALPHLPARDGDAHASCQPPEIQAGRYVLCIAISHPAKEQFLGPRQMLVAHVKTRSAFSAEHGCRRLALPTPRLRVSKSSLQLALGNSFLCMATQASPDRHDVEFQQCFAYIPCC